MQGLVLVDPVDNSSFGSQGVGEEAALSKQSGVLLHGAGWQRCRPPELQKMQVACGARCSSSSSRSRLCRHCYTTSTLCCSLC